MVSARGGGGGGVLTLWVWVPTVGFTAPNFGILTASDLSSINYRPPIFAILVNRPHAKWEPVMYRLYLKHLIIKACLYFVFTKEFISCFKGHNAKACPFRDVPPLQNLRVWGGHRSSFSTFTATAFGVRFTVGT